MSSVTLSPEAEQDFTEALEWYTKRSEQAAEGFVSEFRAALASISDAPKRYAKYGKQHRSYSMHTYPYQIFYFEVDSQNCVVVAVSHTSRRPNWWRKRK